MNPHRFLSWLGVMSDLHRGWNMSIKEHYTRKGHHNRKGMTHRRNKAGSRVHHSFCGRHMVQGKAAA